MNWQREEMRSSVSGGRVQIGSGWHAPEELCCLFCVRWGSKEGFELGTTGSDLGGHRFIPALGWGMDSRGRVEAGGGVCSVASSFENTACGVDVLSFT